MGSGCLLTSRARAASRSCLVSTSSRTSLTHGWATRTCGTSRSTRSRPPSTPPSASVSGSSSTTMRTLARPSPPTSLRACGTSCGPPTGSVRRALPAPPPPPCQYLHLCRLGCAGAPRRCLRPSPPLGCITPPPFYCSPPACSLCRHARRFVATDPPFTSFGGRGVGSRRGLWVMPSLGFQAGLATGASINLITASGRRGALTSGTGVFPRLPSDRAAQHYDPRWSVPAPSDSDPSGALTIADLESMPVPSPLPAPAAPLPYRLPALGEARTVGVVWFSSADLHTPLDRDPPVLRASAAGVSCELSARAASDLATAARQRHAGGAAANATYALVAASGLTALGYYVEACGIGACARGEAPLDCLYAPPPVLGGLRTPASGAGAPGLAVFDELVLTIESTHGNIVLPTAVCADGTVAQPRPSVRRVGAHRARPAEGARGGAADDGDNDGGGDDGGGGDGGGDDGGGGDGGGDDGGRGGSAAAGDTDGGSEGRGVGVQQLVLGAASACSLISATIEARVMEAGQIARCPHGQGRCEHFRIVPPDPSAWVYRVQIWSAIVIGICLAARSTILRVYVGCVRLYFYLTGRPMASAARTFDASDAQRILRNALSYAQLRDDDDKRCAAPAA